MALIVTKAGLAAATQASVGGIDLVIAEVGIGLNGYTPNDTMTALKNEVVRKTLTDAQKTADNQVQLQVLIDDEGEIIGREVGFYLDDGTLFAIDSDPTEIITYKSATEGSQALETFVLVLDAVPINTINVGVSGDLTAHEAKADPHPQYELEADAAISIADLQKQITALADQVEKERVSVGQIIEITGDSTNPATLKGYGTWESFGAGLVTVGAGAHTDDRGESKAWTDGESEGEYKHKQAEVEMPIHAHDVSGTTGSDTHSHSYSGATSNNGLHRHYFHGDEQRDEIGDHGLIYMGKNGMGSDGGGEGGWYKTSQEGEHSHAYSGVTISDTHSHGFSATTTSKGSSNAMNNTQPSIAVYRWKRTA